MKAPTVTTPSPEEGATPSTARQVCPHCKSALMQPGEGKAARQLFGELSFGDMAQITLDAIDDAVLVVNPKGEVIYLNKVAETLTGWSSKEALGRKVEDIFFIVDGVTRQRVASPSIDGHEHQLTLSIGISIYPENGIDAETLMENSDTAMYASKESGRNTYQFFC